MMKTKYIIGLIWLATSLSACNSLFDDELPKSQIAAKEAIKDQASAETALLGVYSYLGEYGIFPPIFWWTMRIVVVCWKVPIGGRIMSVTWNCLKYLRSTMNY